MTNRFAVLGGVIFAVMSTGILGCQQVSKNAGQSGAASGSTPAKSSRVSWSGSQKVEIPDPKYGIVAATLDIPAGWKFAGSMVRTQGCHASQGPSIAFTSLAQDGVTATVGLPGVTWGWSSSPSALKVMATQGHCPGVDITTADKFLTSIVVPNLHPNAKIVAILPLLQEQQARLAEQLEKRRQQTAQAPKQFQMQNQTLDGGRARVQYVRDGRPVEEMITVQVACYENTVPPPFKSGEPPSQARHCSTMSTSITRAPQGHLDEVLAAMQQPHVKELQASFQPNPEWQNRLNQDNMAAFQQGTAANNAVFQQSLQNSKAANDRLLANGRAFQAQQQSSFNNAMARDRATQAGIDAAAHNTVNYSLDRKDYVNPSTGQTVTASSEYNHQWMSSDGSTLIQTQDHSFDPNGQVYPVSQSWTELVPK
jgi:hypothetical protein